MPNFNIFTKKVPHYYKWVAWTQPVFSSALASDGSAVSAEHYNTAYPGYPWGALDGVKTGSADINFWGPPNGSSDPTTAWWKLQLPYKIAITKLTHYTRGGSAEWCGLAGRYYADNLMTLPIGNAISSVTPWEQIVIYDNSTTPLVTDTIYFNKTGTAGLTNKTGGIGELEIVAKKIVEGTAEDYDFIVYS